MTGFVVQGHICGGVFFSLKGLKYIVYVFYTELSAINQNADCLKLMW